MQQPYGTYPYYGQHIYPQTPHIGAGPSNGYPPYYPPAHNTPFIPPAPTPFDLPGNQASQSTPGPSMSRPKRHRSSKVATPAATPFPLKSALKKPTVVAPKPEAPKIARPKTKTYSRRVNQLGRQRTNSNLPDVFSGSRPQEFIPIHLFVSFHGSNEFRIENIMELAINELRERILPIWPYGVDSDEHRGYIWRVKFRNSPWNSHGSDATIAWQIIVELFTLFARRGFTYQTSMNTGKPPPRLIFVVSQMDESSHFFLGYFSRNGRRVTLINPPPHIDVTIGAQLKAVLPRKIGSDRVVDDTMRVIELKGAGFGVTEVEPSHFLMHVLKAISDLGYNLDATIPMARRGLARLGSRRELLVFKGRRV